MTSVSPKQAEHRVVEPGVRGRLVSHQRHAGDGGVLVEQAAGGSGTQDVDREPVPAVHRLPRSGRLLPQDAGEGGPVRGLEEGALARAQHLRVRVQDLLDPGGAALRGSSDEEPAGRALGPPRPRPR